MRTPMTETQETAFLETLRSCVGRSGAPQTARDPVSEAAIRNWRDAMRFDGETVDDAAASERVGTAPAIDRTVDDRQARLQRRADAMMGVMGVQVIPDITTTSLSITNGST